MSPFPFESALSITQDGVVQELHGIPFMESENQRTGSEIKKQIVIVDLDGTIAKPFPGRNMYHASEVHKDTVCDSLKLAIEGYYNQGYQIYMVSARSAAGLAKQHGYDVDRVQLLMKEYGEATGLTTTFHWLRENFIPFDKLILRPDGVSKQDIFMKQDIFKTFIKDPELVFCAFDDNGPIVDLWRSYGIQTYQCAPSWDTRPLKEEAIEMLETNKANPKRWC